MILILQSQLNDLEELARIQVSKHSSSHLLTRPFGRRPRLILPCIILDFNESVLDLSTDTKEYHEAGKQRSSYITKFAAEEQNKINAKTSQHAEEQH
jgi:hypothetical protein